MIRLKILFYWILGLKNNVSLVEIIRFFFKSTTKQKNIGKKLICAVKFKNISQTLFWPIEFDLESIYQVTLETLDTYDWHYYRKKRTDVVKGEILLNIGTAEGLFPLRVVDSCEKISLIEPSKMFAECIKKTFEPKKKATIHNLAVGKIDGVMNFSGG